MLLHLLGQPDTFFALDEAASLNVPAERHGLQRHGRLRPARRRHAPVEQLRSLDRRQVERAHADDIWSTATRDGVYAGAGDPDSPVFAPAGCDTIVQSGGWFWEPGYVRAPPRDSDPQGLFSGPKKCSLR